MSKFGSAGDWPVKATGRRLSNRDIRELEAASPNTFRATIDRAHAFISGAEISERIAAAATHPEVKAFYTEMAAAERAGDQVAAFKLWQAFGRELDEALKVPAPCVEDA